MTKEQTLDNILAQLKEGWDHTDPMKEDEEYFIRRYLTKGWDACDKQMFSRNTVERMLLHFMKDVLQHDLQSKDIPQWLNENYPNK